MRAYNYTGSLAPSPVAHLNKGLLMLCAPHLTCSNSLEAGMLDGLELVRLESLLASTFQSVSYDCICLMRPDVV